MGKLQGKIKQLEELKIRARKAEVETEKKFSNEEDKLAAQLKADKLNLKTVQLERRVKELEKSTPVHSAIVGEKLLQKLFDNLNTAQREARKNLNNAEDNLLDVKYPRGRWYKSSNEPILEARGRIQEDAKSDYENINKIIGKITPSTPSVQALTNAELEIKQLKKIQEQRNEIREKIEKTKIEGFDLQDPDEIIINKAKIANLVDDHAFYNKAMQDAVIPPNSPSNLSAHVASYQAAANLRGKAFDKLNKANENLSDTKYSRLSGDSVWKEENYLKAMEDHQERRLADRRTDYENANKLVEAAKNIASNDKRTPEQRLQDMKSGIEHLRVAQKTRNKIEDKMFELRNERDPNVKSSKQKDLEGDRNLYNKIMSEATTPPNKPSDLQAHIETLRSSGNDKGVLDLRDDFKKTLDNLSSSTFGMISTIMPQKILDLYQSRDPKGDRKAAKEDYEFAQIMIAKASAAGLDGLKQGLQSLQEMRSEERQAAKKFHNYQNKYESKYKIREVALLGQQEKKDVLLRERDRLVEALAKAKEENRPADAEKIEKELNKKSQAAKDVDDEMIKEEKIINEKKAKLAGLGSTLEEKQKNIEEHKEKIAKEVESPRQEVKVHAEIKASADAAAPTPAHQQPTAPKTAPITLTANASVPTPTPAVTQQAKVSADQVKTATGSKAQAKGTTTTPSATIPASSKLDAAILKRLEKPMEAIKVKMETNSKGVTKFSPAGKQNFETFVKDTLDILSKNTNNKNLDLKLKFPKGMNLDAAKKMLAKMDSDKRAMIDTIKVKGILGYTEYYYDKEQGEWLNVKDRPKVKAEVESQKVQSETPAQDKGSVTAKATPPAPTLSDTPAAVTPIQPSPAVSAETTPTTAQQTTKTAAETTPAAASSTLVSAAPLDTTPQPTPVVSAVAKPAPPPPRPPRPDKAAVASALQKPLTNLPSGEIVHSSQSSADLGSNLETADSNYKKLRADGTSVAPSDKQPTHTPQPLLTSAKDSQSHAPPLSAQVTPKPGATPPPEPSKEPGGEPSANRPRRSATMP